MKNKIIAILKSSTRPCSGEDISRQLKISRAGIWKNIQELRKEGYNIEAASSVGYRLLTPPDKLLAREIQYGLETKYLGKDVVHYDSIESTMDAAFRLGMDGAEEGTLVCAEEQTKGKGRLGRLWLSPKSKGIYMSLILRPPLASTEISKLTLLSAVATCEAIKKVSGVQAAIKWPNDLLVNDKKIAGILTEMSAEMDKVRFIVIGIGINVNTDHNQLLDTATSIKEEARTRISRVKLVQEILLSFEYWYDSLKADGFTPAITRWKQLSGTLGRRVRIVEANIEIEGEAVDLDEYGGLIIRNDQGDTIKRMTGDIIQV